MTPAGGTRRGTTLAIVLWLLVATGALTAVAGLAARLDLALAVAWRDHAGALALAEAGVAEATVGRAAGATSGGRSGVEATGRWEAAWEPDGSGTRIVATGSRGAAERTLEVRITETASGRWEVSAWREGP